MSESEFDSALSDNVDDISDKLEHLRKSCENNNKKTDEALAVIKKDLLEIREVYLYRDTELENIITEQISHIYQDIQKTKEFVIVIENKYKNIIDRLNNSVEKINREIDNSMNYKSISRYMLYGLTIIPLSTFFLPVIRNLIKK
jgi:ribosome-binding ATPase YchF (GTP1/OBG family)